MKKALAIVLALAMCLSFVACGAPASQAPASTPGAASEPAAPAAPTGPVELNVITSFGGDDGNRKDYEIAYKSWETATGNKVLDGSASYNEEQKAKIMTMFETNAEPDVLYYFNGADANKLVENNKVVSLEEIRSVYPDFGTNMDDNKMNNSCASPADGKVYALPLIGYWEAMFVNKAVLAAAGADVPGATTTWADFMAICEKVKASGKAAIAAPLSAEPHYLFEYFVYNQDGPKTHNAAPKAKGDDTYKAWAAGLDTFAELNTKGYFTKDALTCSNAEAIDAFLSGDAAFFVGGSWNLNSVLTGVTADQYENFTVTYVPASDKRATNDLIGGLSMGFYITRKAWENPEKRDAAVSFVKVMTQDNVVASYNQTATNALKNGSPTFGTPDVVTAAALDMIKGFNAISPAAQDNLDQTTRDAMFKLIPDVASGKMTGAEAIDAALALS